MNIAGKHVSGGKLYPGYSCNRNGGAFTWSDARGPQFFYKDYAHELARAAEEGGMGFAQEMMIHEGEEKITKRKPTERCVFRAICLNKDGKFAIYESTEKVEFGTFTKALLADGVTEALYTDMGTGWNYCFYRLQEGEEAKFLHWVPRKGASNFIVLKVR